MRESFKKLIKKNGLRLVKCPSGTKGVLPHYYAIDEKDIIGEGNFGRVCKAYLVDPKTGKNYVTFKNSEKPKPYAVKIFKNADKFDKKEAQLLSQYIMIEKPVEDNNEILLFSEFIEGENLGLEVKDMIVLAKSVENLTFPQRINLLNTVMLCVNMIHHNTPRTGSAIMHSDLRVDNVRIKTSESGNKVDTTILDFGVSEKMADEPNQMVEGLYKGKIHYAPVEVLDKKYGLKSDIYALVPMFIAVLGGSDPMEDKSVKNKSGESNPDKLLTRVFCEAPYNYENMFTGYDMPKYSINVKKLILNFLSKMQNNNYDNRPDSDVVLRFITTLNNYCKICDAKSHGYDENDMNIFEVKLALMAAGLWKEKISVVVNEGKNELISFEQYDFAGNPNICKKIIELNKNDNLDTDGLMLLFNPGIMAKKPEIKISNEHDNKKPLEIKITKSGYAENQHSKSEQLPRHKLDETTPLNPVSERSSRRKGKWG